MHSRTGHLTGALVGLAAAFLVGYLLLESAAQLDWNAYLSGPWATAVTPAAVTSSGGIPTLGGSVLAAGMLLVIAIITGLLASSPRLSPLAPLLAGLALLAVGLAGQFAYFQVDSWMFRNMTVTLASAGDSLLRSGIWQLLGGILLVSAAMPWRRTGKLAPPRPGRTEIGVLIGLAGIAGLWYLLVNPVGYTSVTGKTGLPDAFDLILMPQAAAAAVVGVFAGARWISPAAAMFSGIPLLAAGLFLVIAPVGTAQWTYPVIWGAQRISSGASGQSLNMGVLALVGGLLLVSAAPPWRWRQTSTPAAAPAAMAEAS